MEESIIINSNGINFIREGYCKRCGACEKPKCPHFKMVDGLATCDIYKNREGICKICSEIKSKKTGKNIEISHENCEKFPNSPFCDVVLKGICGYKFKPVTEEDNKKFKNCLGAWQLHI